MQTPVEDYLAFTEDERRFIAESALKLALYIRAQQQQGLTFAFRRTNENGYRLLVTNKVACVDFEKVRDPKNLDPVVKDRAVASAMSGISYVRHEISGPDKPPFRMGQMMRVAKAIDAEAARKAGLVPADFVP